jgi:uncharacterized protein YjiK
MYRAKECFAVAVAALSLAAPAAAVAAPPDLSTYVRVGRYDLPAAAQEASAVTYDAARDSLFVVGDGATSVVQVSKTGQLIDTMALSGFDDTEGITSIGGGQFVVAEERERRVTRITYQGGGTATRTGSVKLGTTIGNTGIEGLSADPTGGFVLVKESGPLGIFRTEIDWAAGTATNGSPTTENSTNLFDPALAGVTDFADSYATADALLVISQESGRIVNLTRTGRISSALSIGVANDGHEGITMDAAGRIYIVNETGSATATPQLWVYAPSTTPNQPPTAVALTNQVASVPASANRVKVAGVTVTDDGIGTNALSASGAAFEVDATGLYLKAGTAPGSYTTTVSVDDQTVGTTPDATSAPLTFTVTAAPAPPSLIVSELSPWSSGNSPYEADWFEVTNKGAQAVDLTGYKVDDSSNAFASAIALTGVTSIAPGKSVLFMEGNATTVAEFRAHWGLPDSLPIGTYSGSGIGLSTDGDAVNLFDAAGNRVFGVTFGASTTGFTFDNSAGAAAVTALSVAGRNGAYTAGGETGSPGAVAPSLVVSEAAPWSSGDSPVGADWIELTNTSAHPVDITGFKIDDSSNSFATAIALNGVTTIAGGESVIFLEGQPTVANTFKAAWFGANAPVGLQVGTYSGGGIGLSTDGDAVNLFDAVGNRITGITFGASTTGFTFDNAAGVSGAVNTLAVAGVNGAFTVNGMTGSPGAIAAPYEEVKVGGAVSGLVPPQLSIVLGAPAVFAPFTAGVARDYEAFTTATVTSTAGEATLSVSDPSTASPGHLVNGTLALPQALQVKANGGAYAPVGGTLLAYGGPISGDEVSIGVKQSIGAKDALRTGTYTKTLTFTLSTSTP